MVLVVVPSEWAAFSRKNAAAAGDAQKITRQLKI